MSIQAYDVSSQLDELQLYICDPGGNLTYIIVEEEQESLNAVDTTLHERILKRFPQLEQGGRLMPPRLQGSAARLEMAGGELCGNALRCLAGLVAATWANEMSIPSTLIRTEEVFLEGSTLTARLEISGYEGQLECRVLRDGEQYSVEVAMPLIREKAISIEQTLSLSRRDLLCDVVRLSGISHVVFQNAGIASLTDKERSALLALAEEEFSLQDSPAIGLIDLIPSEKGLQIDPFVWVRTVETFFFETACGSGTVACAISQSITANDNSDVERTYLQPSGKSLVVRLSRARGSEGEQVYSTTLSGRVAISS